MRASRLVNLLLLLQSRGGLTAAELARELEVSVRTVHRDVEELSAAGVPIFAERGPLGGIRLVDGYRTRLTGMTADEAEALFLSGLPGPAAQLGLGTVVAAAQLKVMAALPTGAAVASLAHRPALPPRCRRLVPGDRGGAPPGHRCRRRSGRAARVRIAYERGEGTTERIVGPLGLVLKGGVWYVVGHVDGQIRTYRASRVRDAELLEERVERPTGFDLAAYWAESSAAYERESRAIEVIVRIPRTAVADRPTSSADDARTADGSTSRIPTAGRACGCLSWPEEVPASLLVVGSGIEVLEPTEIRDRVIATARRMVERYEPVETRGDVVPPHGRPTRPPPLG